MPSGRQTRLLTRPNARTIRWPTLAVIVALGAWIVQSGAREGGDPATVALPVATAALGLWLCLLFEDDAADVTAALPTPLPLRRAVRVAVALPAVLASWFTYTWIGPLNGPTDAMVVWLVAVVLVALACSAVATRLVAPERSGVTAATGMVLVLFGTPIALAVILDRPISIDPVRAPAGGTSAYWTGMLAVATLTLLLAHRDPSRRGLSSRVDTPSTSMKRVR
ncbi:MAG: hypothetical protein WEA10_07065 [Actinomycetota bacterium]